MPHEDNRPSPEQLLERVERQERREKRGRLKVFLGYSSGVGKSAQMLDEGRRRRERGEDLVVAATQPKSTPECNALLAKLEVIPTLKIEGQDVIDVAAVLRRNPRVVLIDGLAYDNPPGSRHPRRSGDIDEILDAGISVITSISLQYIEEFQDEIELITGKRATQFVSRKFLEKAAEIVIVDAPTEEHRLSRLREMALLLAAQVVDVQLRDYLEEHGMEEVWGNQERFLVCITPKSHALRMIESGQRNARRFRGELYAVYVRQNALSAEDQVMLERNLKVAEDHNAQVMVIEGDDPMKAVLTFAREHGVTQIFIGHSLGHGLLQSFQRTPVERLIEAANGIDVRIFPQ